MAVLVGVDVGVGAAVQEAMRRVRRRKIFGFMDSNYTGENRRL
jgi:hypothetical protein